MGRAKARTHTKPLSRISSGHRDGPRPYEKMWVYRHSNVDEGDLAVIAAAFGISERDVVATAVRLAGPQTRR